MCPRQAIQTLEVVSLIGAAARKRAGAAAHSHRPAGAFPGEDGYCVAERAVPVQFHR